MLKNKCVYIYIVLIILYIIFYTIYIYTRYNMWARVPPLNRRQRNHSACAGFVFLVMLLFKWIVPGQYRPNWMNLFWICVPPGSFSFFGNTVLRNQSPGATATFFNPGSARRGVCRLVRNALMKTVFLKPMVARHHYTYHVGRYIYMILQHIAWYVSENDMFMIFMVDLNRLPSDCALMAGIWILLCLVVASGMVPWLNENCLAAKPPRIVKHFSITFQEVSIFGKTWIESRNFLVCEFVVKIMRLSAEFNRIILLRCTSFTRKVRILRRRSGDPCTGITCRVIFSIWGSCWHVEIVGWSIHIERLRWIETLCPSAFRLTVTWDIKMSNPKGKADGDEVHSQLAHLPFVKAYSKLPKLKEVPWRHCFLILHWKMQKCIHINLPSQKKTSFSLRLAWHSWSTSRGSCFLCTGARSRISLWTVRMGIPSFKYVSIIFELLYTSYDYICNYISIILC